MLLPSLSLSCCSSGRSFTYIKERYGPYVAGAYFVLKQGGAVKYEDRGVRMGGREAGSSSLSPRLFSQTGFVSKVLPPPG